jgi:hypothetical protein
MFAISRKRMRVLWTTVACLLAAVVASAAGTPFSFNQIDSWYSPKVSWSGTDQPAPRREARSFGRATAIGASPAAYLSAWRICSVDAGIFA